jgi:predicted RNase H-like HicB family nuclease
MSDLVKLEPLAALQAPPTADLLKARYAILSSVELQRLFGDAVEQGWGIERLIQAMQEALERVLEEQVGEDVARYLAEEFLARDKDKTLLVSADTGIAVAQVPPDTLYQPDPVPREGSDKLAQPLPRLKPEVEAAIVQHHHSRGADARVTKALEVRARSSELQRQEGDRRFRISTRAGRKGLAEQLLQELPTLLSDHSGACGRLLSLCHVDEPIPTQCRHSFAVTLATHTSLLVADGLSNNFRHDWYRAVREQIRAGWTRELGNAVAEQAHRARSAASVGLGWQDDSGGFLIAAPEVTQVVRHRNTLWVTCGRAVMLYGNLYLTLGGTVFDHYEGDARWNVDASVAVMVHFDPEQLHPLVFEDAASPGWLAELVR